MQAAPLAPTRCTTPCSMPASSQLHTEEKEVTVPVLLTTVSKHISKKVLGSFHLKFTHTHTKEKEKRKKEKKRKPWKNFSWRGAFYEIWISSEMLPGRDRTELCALGPTNTLECDQVLLLPLSSFLQARVGPGLQQSSGSFPDMQHCNLCCKPLLSFGGKRR